MTLVKLIVTLFFGACPSFAYVAAPTPQGELGDPVTSDQAAIKGGASPELESALARIEKILASGEAPSLRRIRVEWKELQLFHRELWRTMALDPGSLPANEVPERLQSRALTDELEKKFEDLSNSVLIQHYGLEEPFSEYVDVVSQILALRRSQEFVSARSLAKRGLLDESYEHLNQALENAQRSSEALVLPLMSSETERDLKEAIAGLRKTLPDPRVLKAPLSAQPEVAPAVAHALANANAPASVGAPLSQAGSSVKSPRGGSSVLWAFLGFALALPVGALLYRAISGPGAEGRRLSNEVPKTLRQKDRLEFAFQKRGTQSLLSLPFPPDFDFAQWLKDYRTLLSRYRDIRAESEPALRQVPSFLEDMSKFFMKYFQGTRESYYRAGFTDLELAVNDVVTGLSGSLQSSDQYCRSLMAHLSLLATALQNHSISGSIKGEKQAEPPRLKAV